MDKEDEQQQDELQQEEQRREEQEEQQEEQSQQQNDSAKRVSSLSTFGSRMLESEDDVFAHNAWDNVEWSEEQEESARTMIEKQWQGQVDEAQREIYEKQAASFWDKFYSNNTNRFFKDRHWLRLEFPEIFEHLRKATETGTSFTMCEIGCGAGNTVFPFLKEVGHDVNVMVYACDYSAEAINVVKTHSEYNESKCKAFVYDITSPDIPPEIPAGSLDIITSIFVLSAIHPSTWRQAIANLKKLLKPGGLVLFRDYGRYDLTQLRFKSGRLLEDNFYCRGDGTRVYFFTNEELQQMFGEDGGFETLFNGVDRRLLVNRTRKLKMYRCWVQAKFKKTVEAAGDE
eukprot:jgi/Hompol1/3888/HPOL_003384-RA